MNNNKEEKQDIYFLYKRGRQIRVSKEEWERSWLDWYMSSKNRS